MLVLALEFSRGASARDSHPSGTDWRTGAYGASGRPEPKLESASPKGRPWGRSFKTEERKPGGRDTLDPVADGLSAGEPHEGAAGRPLRERGGPPSVGGWPWTPSSQCSTSVVVGPESGRQHSLERR